MKSADGDIGQHLMAIATAMARPLSAVADDKYDLLKQQVEIL